MTGPVLIDYPERGFAGGETRHVSGWQRELGGIEALPDEPIDLARTHRSKRSTIPSKSHREARSRALRGVAQALDGAPTAAA